MVEGRKWQILQIWLFSTSPNSQTARLEHYDVHCKSFSWISHLRNFCSFGLVVDHFGASWKAVIARSLTFEPRQIEGWAWWQNWPNSCALQLCCWVEDLKTNISGWWEFQPVTIPPLAETKLRSCSGRSQQNEPWNLLCISRLVESVIFIYANPQTFSKISFSQSLAETSIEEKYGP